MGRAPSLRQLCFQIAGLLFRNEKSNQVIVTDFLRNVIEVELAGFCLTRALENGTICLAAFCVEDPPDSLLLRKTVDIRAARTDRKVIGAASLVEQALSQFRRIHGTS